MIKRTEITTERFTLHDLTEDDVTERYLSWFADSDTKKFIDASSTTKSLLDLRNYVRERVDREDILFLGIFDKINGLHIGNIKFEPVNSKEGYSIMGIMIGDPLYRGRGVATEILRSTGQWLKMNRNIKQVVLGVSKENAGAIRSYEKVGFRLSDTPYIPDPPQYAVTMVWQL